MSNTNEKLLPRIAGILVALIWIVLNWFVFYPAFEWSIDRDHPHLLLGTVTYGSITAGFFSISVSVLFLQSELMNAIKESSYDDLLISYIMEFICSVLALTFTSLFFLFALNISCINANKMFSIIVSGVWLGLIVWTSCCLIRLMRVLVGIIKIR